jgi:CDGSH-type Zn-finger protein
MAEQNQQQVPLPWVVTVAAGQAYSICGCDKRAVQPQCDKTGKPCAAVTHQSPQAQTLLICRCGASKQLPLCDGSHNRMTQVSRKTLIKEFFMEPYEALKTALRRTK